MGSCRAAGLRQLGRAGKAVPEAAVASVNPAEDFGVQSCGAARAQLGLQPQGWGSGPSSPVLFKGSLRRDPINQHWCPSQGCPHAVTQVTHVLPTMALHSSSDTHVWSPWPCSPSGTREALQAPLAPGSWRASCSLCSSWALRGTKHRMSQSRDSNSLIHGQEFPREPITGLGAPQTSSHSIPGPPEWGNSRLKQPKEVEQGRMDQVVGSAQNELPGCHRAQNPAGPSHRHIF